MRDCIICNGCESSKDYVEEPTLSSFENLLTRARKRLYFKDAIVLCFIELTNGLSAEDLQAKGYKKVTRNCQLFQRGLYTL